MIIKVQADDGPDLIIMVGDGRGTVGIATTNVGKSQPDLEDFTIEEAQTIVGALNIAIKIALEERDYLEELK